MKYSTVLFDFDGTLADTQELGFHILNDLAPEFGFAPITREEIPALKEMSAWQLFVKRSGIPLWNLLKIRRLERRVREEFRKRGEEVQFFEGVPEMLRKLHAAGCEVGIVTSNHREVVAGALERAGVEVDFVHAGSRFFGKARAIRRTLTEQNIDASTAVYVGDELRDVEACSKAGIDMIAVGWGYNAAEALRAVGAKVVATPAELMIFLCSQEQ